MTLFLYFATIMPFVFQVEPYIASLCRLCLHFAVIFRVPCVHEDEAPWIPHDLSEKM